MPDGANPSFPLNVAALPPLHLRDWRLSKDGKTIAVRRSALPVGQTGKIVVHDGHEYLLRPYDLSHWRALRQMGVNVPCPWSQDYALTLRGTTPMRHQIATIAFICYHARAYVLNGIGSGKTLAALWAMDYLQQFDGLGQVLILSPLSTLRSVWDTEIFKHLPHKSRHVVHGAGKTAFLKDPSLYAGVNFLIGNHELCRDAAFRDAWKGQAIVIDEGSEFRNFGTEKQRALKALMKKAYRAVWMTATPTPNSPLDAYSQAACMGTNGGYTKGAFKAETMTQITAYKWAAKPDARRYVAAILKPSITFRTQDCIDLPPLTYETREVEMTKEQRAAYKTMRDEAVLEIRQGVVCTAVNAAVKINKLIQVACGYVYASAVDASDPDAEPEAVEIEATNKLAELERVIDEAGTPVIVFAPYRAVVAALALRLAKSHEVRTVTGDTALGERTTTFQQFQRGEVRVIVAHPRTMSHGLTLTEAATIIWYGPVHSNETYTQANGRIHRVGQTRHCSIIHLASSPAEAEIYTRLKERKRVQDGVLQLLAGKG